jgi:hypothetical protein
MRTRGGKADLEHLMRAPPGVEYRPAAALAVRVDEFGDRRVEARLPQRFDDEIALPGAVARKVPVLYGATAAYAEMRADGRDALGAWRVDVQETAAIWMPGDRVDFDRFTGQGAGHIDWAVGAAGDAGTAMPELLDDEALSHVRPR